MRWEIAEQLCRVAVVCEVHERTHRALVRLQRVRVRAGWKSSGLRALALSFWPPLLQKHLPIATPLQNNASVDSWTIIYSMAKKSKAPPQHKPRPKRAGGEQPAPRRSKREKKKALTAAELAASTAPRCGQKDCKVCNPQPCNNCTGCRDALAHGWNLSKKCNEAKKLREKQCPNMAPAPRDDGVDPRKLDKKGPHFRASTEIICVMDALADSTELESEDADALAYFKDSLITSGRLDARWAPLDKIKARDDYDVDDINADDGAQKAIEAAVRWVHFKGGSKPSVEEMSKMGPLEMRTVVRVLSYIAPMNYRTRAQSRSRSAAMIQSHSDQARDTFVKLVEGGKYDGVHVSTALARKKDEPWPEYWWRSLDLLKKKKEHLTGARKRFYHLLSSVRNGAAIWVCRPEMRAWLRERECQYQCMKVC